MFPPIKTSSRMCVKTNSAFSSLTVFWRLDCKHYCQAFWCCRKWMLQEQGNFARATFACSAIHIKVWIVCVWTWEIAPQKAYLCTFQECLQSFSSPSPRQTHSSKLIHFPTYAEMCYKKVLLETTLKNLLLKNITEGEDLIVLFSLQPLHPPSTYSV